MPLTRRRLLRAACAGPFGLALAAVLARAGEVAGTAAAALRPSASGTSATRCAACGADDHAMLDPRCPSARKVI